MSSTGLDLSGVDRGSVSVGLSRASHRAVKLKTEPLVQRDKERYDETEAICNDIEDEHM